MEIRILVVFMNPLPTCVNIQWIQIIYSCKYFKYIYLCGFLGWTPKYAVCCSLVWLINFCFHLYFINMLWIFIQISSSGSESTENLTQSWLFCSQWVYQTSSETYLRGWISKAGRNDRIILSGTIKPGKCNWRQNRLLMLPVYKIYSGAIISFRLPSMIY